MFLPSFSAQQLDHQFNHNNSDDDDDDDNDNSY
jgi:hypothetical protein